eukprot:Skav211605  [mRNA]  locus=scaffold2962:183164:183715:- [translate_table: standard]
MSAENAWWGLLTEICNLPADFKAELNVERRFDGLAKDLKLQEIFNSYPELRSRLGKCGGLAKLWEFCHQHWEREPDYMNARQRLLEDLHRTKVRMDAAVCLYDFHRAQSGRDFGCNALHNAPQLSTSLPPLSTALLSKEEWIKWLTREAHVEEHLAEHPALTQGLRVEGGLCGVLSVAESQFI